MQFVNLTSMSKLNKNSNGLHGFLLPVDSAVSAACPRPTLRLRKRAWYGPLMQSRQRTCGDTPEGNAICQKEDSLAEGTKTVTVVAMAFCGILALQACFKPTMNSQAPGSATPSVSSAALGAVFVSGSVMKARAFCSHRRQRGFNVMKENLRQRWNRKPKLILNTNLSE